MSACKKKAPTLHRSGGSLPPEGAELARDGPALRSMATAAKPAPTPVAATSRLEWLRSQPRKSGEASFFWYETRFQCEAVKVLPGEYFVSKDNLMIMTTLGSCIAVCLWDPQTQVGGLNHFMMPGDGQKTGRYGQHAMEVLIKEVLLLGAQRTSLEAKVFGGGQVVAAMENTLVGEQNTRFALDYLQAVNIPVVRKDVLDIYPRKVGFNALTGNVFVKRLTSTQDLTLT